MATIPQIRARLLEAFPENQADLLARVVIESHDDLVNRADFHQLTGVVKELADAQARTEARVEELAEAQTKTERQLGEVVQTQQKMLIRLDRLDGHMLENSLARNLPAYVGREFRRCRVIDRAEFVEGLEGRLAEAELADLIRSDIIATARDRDRVVYLVVEASCTADADDIDRVVRRKHALERVGIATIGMLACEMISPQTLDEARRRGLRVMTSGWLLPDAA